MTRRAKRELVKSATDPLVLTNGEVVEPETRDEWDESELLPPGTAVPFKAYRPIGRRVMSELRADPQAINVAVVVLGHTLLGISDAEICSATGLTAMDVAKVRDTRVYSDAFELVMRELINANSEYIECRLSAYSTMALNNVAQIARTARNTGYRLRASQDILDRAGHRPQDQSNRQNSGMNELHIVVTAAKDNVDTKLEFKVEPRKELTNGHSSEQS